MVENVKDEISQALRTYLNEHIGLNFNERQSNEMLGKIEQASISFGFSRVSHFITWLLNNQLNADELSRLAAFLTIGETYFMREKKAFDFLEQIYLPGLIHKRLSTNKKISIWCAGCATGEEAYSLAVILHQSIPKIEEWNVSILATDINPRFLEKAKNGIYTKWSFRNNDEKFSKDYFIKTGVNEFQVIPEIRRMVHFANLNLAGNGYPSESNGTSDVDIIFCRNVLIYFSNAGISAVTERLYNSLKDGGILVVSPVEMSALVCRKFDSIKYSGYSIYHKNCNIAVQNLKVSLVPKSRIKATTTAAFSNTKTEAKIFIKQSKSNVPKLKRTSALNNVETNDHNNFSLEEVRSLFAKGDFEASEKLLDNYLGNSESDSLDFILMLAKTKANLGKLKEAESWCTKGLSINKLDASLHYLMATIMQENEDDEKAISGLKMALYLEPNFVLAHFLLGTLLTKKGDETGGKKAYKNALSSLAKYAPDEILPESDGISAGRFTAILNSITN